MSKMIDLGKKVETTAAIATQEGHSSQEMNYPEFHVEHDQIPVDGEAVGKHLNATVKLHVRGHEVRKGADGKEIRHTHFAVKGIQIHPEIVDDESPEHEASESEAEEKAEHKVLESKSERMKKIKQDYIKGGE